VIGFRTTTVSRAGQHREADHVQYSAKPRAIRPEDLRSSKRWLMSRYGVPVIVDNAVTTSILIDIGPFADQIHGGHGTTLGGALDNGLFR
jgi:hypothetical protein